MKLTLKKKLKTGRSPCLHPCEGGGQVPDFDRNLSRSLSPPPAPQSSGTQVLEDCRTILKAQLAPCAVGNRI